MNLTLGFWCYSLALNVIATALIVGRLAYFRYQFQRVLGSQHASQYTGIMAMIIESELLYTMYLVLYIVPFVLNNPLVNVFVQGPSAVQVRVWLFTGIALLPFAVVLVELTYVHSRSPR